MSGKMVALRVKDVTPEMVLQNLIEEKPKHVFIVSFDESGEGSVWASGDLSRMSDAALILTMRATQNAIGDIAEGI